MLLYLLQFLKVKRDATNLKLIMTKDLENSTLSKSTMKTKKSRKTKANKLQTRTILKKSSSWRLRSPISKGISSWWRTRRKRHIWSLIRCRTGLAKWVLKSFLTLVSTLNQDSVINLKTFMILWQSNSTRSSRKTTIDNSKIRALASIILTPSTMSLKSSTTIIKIWSMMWAQTNSLRRI